MNTIQELLDNDIDIHTAEMMLNEYSLSFEQALKMPRITLGRPRKEVNNG